MEYMLLFLMGSIFIFFPLVFLKRKHFGGFLELNYFNLWFIFFILLGFVGALITILGGASDSYFIGGILYKNDIVVKGSFFILWSGLGMFYSFILFLFLFDKNSQYTWKKVVERKTKDRENEFLVILLFCCFSLLSFVYYQLVIYPSPLILALQGDALGAAIKRIDITRDLSLYANTYFIALGSLVAQLFSIQLVCRNKVSFVEKSLKYIMIILSMLFLLTTSEKAPIIFYILALYISSGFAKNKILKVNFKLIASFVFVVFFIYYFIVADDFNEIKNLVFERIFFAQMAIVYYSLDYYNSTNFIGLSSLGGFFNKLFQLPVEKASSEVLMASYFHEMLAGGGWNINGIYISDAWSNYGVIGVVVAPIYVGFVVAVLYLFLVRVRGTFGKALLVYCSAMSFSFLTSFNLYIYNTIFVLIVMIFLFRLIFLRLFKSV